MSGEWLNYHHLLYFWTVAKTGSVTRAAEQLMLAQPTISTQIKRLEKALGCRLFDRAGRSLSLTDAGRTVLDYAEEIFGLGRELMATVRRGEADRSMRLRVGVADVVPKIMAEQLIQPALALAGSLSLTCREDKASSLQVALAGHALDLVLSDAPMSPTLKVQAHNHLLGTCGVMFYATGKLASRYRRRFPESLNDAPVLLPTDASRLRRRLEAWFVRTELRPRIVAEFDDTALMKTFAQGGLGIVPVPEAIGEQVARQYGLRKVGVASDVVEQVYAITMQRRITHPAVAAICQAARARFAAA